MHDWGVLELQVVPSRRSRNLGVVFPISTCETWTQCPVSDIYFRWDRDHHAGPDAMTSSSAMRAGDTVIR